jgi:hypothetical protein
LPHLGSFKKARDSTTCSKCSQHLFEEAQNELTQTDFYLGLHHAEQSSGVALCATNLSARTICFTQVLKMILNLSHVQWSAASARSHITIILICKYIAMLLSHRPGGQQEL